MFVPRVSPKNSPHDAFDALWAGDDHRAIALAHNVDAPGFAALRARAYLRLGRHDRVFSEYVRRTLTSYDAHEGLQLAGAAAQAFLAEGDDERARDALARARGLASRPADPLGAAYCAAVTCTIERDAEIVTLRRSLDTGFEALGRTRSRSREKRHHLEPELVRARLHASEASYHARRDDREAHGASLIAAAACVDRAERSDDALEAELLTDLAAFVYFAPSHDARRFLEVRAASFPWSHNTDAAETAVHRALVNHERVFGSTRGRDGAMARTAPTLAARLGDTVDALLRDRWNDRDAWLAELRFAITLAHDIDWNEVSARELLELATLAALVAPFDLPFARSAKTIVYRRLGRARATEPADYPARAKKSVAFMDACVAKAEGNLAGAVHEFGRVSHDARRCGDHTFAIVAGIERYAIAGERRDLEAAGAFVSAYRASSFARRVAESLAALADAAPGDFPYLGAYARVVATGADGRGSAAAAVTPHGRADRTA